MPPLPLGRAAAACIPLLLAPALAAGAELPFQTEVESLPSGLRVVLVPFDSPGLVAYYTLVRTGSRNEVEEGHTGFAHLFEHMMFRGTEKVPSFDDAMADAGWHNNAWTSDDETLYTDFGPSDSLPRVIEVEADRFRNLKYSEAHFRTEALAVLGEYNKNASQPWLKLEEALHETAFTAHTYRHTTMGFLRDIEAMPEKYQYSLKFFSRFYRPDNCVIFVVGDFDRGEVMKHIRAHYGGWEGKAEAPAVTPEPPQKEERRKHVPWPSEVLPRVLWAYKMPAASDCKASALQGVLFEYLFGETSPLHLDLVLERRLSEPLHPWGRPKRDPYVWAFLSTAKSKEAIPEIQKAVDAAIAALAEGAVDAGRLERIKSHYRYRTILGLDDAEKVASQLARWMSPTGDLAAGACLLDAIEGLTPVDVTTFTRDRLGTKGRTVITLAPEGGAP